MGPKSHFASAEVWDAPPIGVPPLLVHTTVMPYHHELYYEVEGRGRPLLFLHPPGLSGLYWRPILDRLAGRLQAVTIDLPGHGRSGGRDQPPLPGHHAGHLAQGLWWAAPPAARPYRLLGRPDPAEQPCRRRTPSLGPAPRPLRLTPGLPLLLSRDLSLGSGSLRPAGTLPGPPPLRAEGPLGPPVRTATGRPPSSLNWKRREGPAISVVLAGAYHADERRAPSPAGEGARYCRGTTAAS
jgi:hypothetical protein